MSSLKGTMLIDGKLVEGEGRRIEVRNPFNNEILGTVREATEAEVNGAIEAALYGFKAIFEMPSYERSRILQQTSRLIAGNSEKIAKIMSLESGKTIREARGEVSRASQTFQFAAEEAKRIYGEVIPMDSAIGGENRIGFTLREPIGIVGAITPFNFPLNLVAHKVAPAIAAGNSVVLKPTTLTPFTSIKLGEIMQEAGVPAGVLNIITGPGSSVGEKIVQDDRIAMVTFTGSPSVGKKIRDRAGLKRVTLELGSNSAVIVDRDADLKQAIPRCVTGSFTLAGQVCISVQRIYLHRDIKEVFLKKFLSLTKNLKLGNPLSEETDVGPMIAEAEAKRAEEWLREAIQQGAQVLIGGRRNGTLFEPTVLDRVLPTMKVVTREVFAPIVCMITFDELDEAISMINESRYGLQAGIYTSDIARAFKAAKNIQAGGVLINEIPTWRLDHMPYGGVKESGMGREGLKYAVQEMTETKLVVFNF